MSVPIPSARPIAEPVPTWRARALVLGLLVGWTVLGARLVQLQYWDRGELTARVLRQQSLTETIPARPGDIVDRHGRVLATTVTARSLFVVPSRIEDPAGFAAKLAPAISLDPTLLERRIVAASERHFLWIARRIDEETADRVKAADLEPRTWGFREEFERRYPQGRFACHVLGLRDIDGRGRGGVEESQDRFLKGTDGRRTLVRDARGRVIDVRDHVESAAVPGRTVELTIDTVVQLHAERILSDLAEEWRPLSACAIVVDVPTCELLAVASVPAFDPNDPSDVEPGAWKNTTVASVFEPGSTFKPIVVARAIETGVLASDDTLDCEHGAYRMGPRVLHDHHPYGALSVADVLVKSSNIGMAKIGERLGNDGLFDAVTAFGFGRRTGVELPGEIDGLLRPLSKWTIYSTGSVPMGQEIAVTPMQLATAHAALANGGILRNPRLVRRIVRADSDPNDTDDIEPALVTSRVVSNDVAEWVVGTAMREVVERGTGKRARIEGYDVFGKTGTAQKFEPETGRYSNTRHVCNFVCGAPADAPRVVVVVSVDEPTAPGRHYGGTVAAPAARDLLEETLRHLHVPPRVKPSP